MGDSNDGFFSRWSRRKAQARNGAVHGDTATTSPLTQEQASPSPPDRQHAVAAPSTAAQHGAAQARPGSAQTTVDLLPPIPRHGPDVRTDSAALPPPPTMEDVAGLTQNSDYSRFVSRGVDPGVKNAALHKLFADPHFNVMDGLDVYIDDYGRPDPLPQGMLEKMVQSEALGLFAKANEKGGDAPEPSLHSTAQHTCAVAEPVEDSAPPEQSESAPTGPSFADVPVRHTESTTAEPVDHVGSPRQPSETLAHENPDLRLQPHHAVGPARLAGPGGHGAPGPEQDPWRQR